MFHILPNTALFSFIFKLYIFFKSRNKLLSKINTLNFYLITPQVSHSQSLVLILNNMSFDILENISNLKPRTNLD